MNPNIPPGWTQHPQSPLHMYNATTQQVLEIPVAAAPPLPPPPIPAVPAIPAVPVVAQAPAAGADDLVQQLLEKSKRGGAKQFGSDFIWLDFESVQRAGDTSTMLLRFVEGAPRADGTTPPFCIDQAQHRIPINFMPPGAQKDSKKKIHFATCLNNPGGPQNCPVCAVWNDVARGPDREQWYWVRAQARFYWQGFNLAEPMKHFVQVRDAGGQPVSDASGRPMTQMVPGVFVSNKRLTNSILHLMQHRQKSGKRMTSWEYGFAVALTKEKTGKLQTDVEFNAIPDEEGVVPAVFDAARPHLLNLEERFARFPKVEEMQAIADSLRAQISGASQYNQQAPAQYGYAPQHQQVQQYAPQQYAPPQVQAAPQQYAPPPAAPAMPTYVAPPPMPSSYVPPLPAPPLGVPQQAASGAPPGPRPSPGMPTAPAPGAPPAPDAAFEKNFGQIPF